MTERDSDYYTSSEKIGLVLVWDMTSQPNFPDWAFEWWVEGPASIAAKHDLPNSAYVIPRDGEPHGESFAVLKLDQLMDLVEAAHAAKEADS